MDSKTNGKIPQKISMQLSRTSAKLASPKTSPAQIDMEQVSYNYYEAQYATHYN